MARAFLSCAAWVVLFLVIPCCTGGRAQAQIRLGQPVPALHLGSVLAGPRNIPIAGHAMLIEFWATWCAPCRAAIPHLNQLAEQFRGRGIDFVAMSCETPEVVKLFLTRYPMAGTVAVDADCATDRLFSGPGYPSTVLIGSDGKLAAVTFPSNVTPAVLNALLSQEDLPLAPAAADLRWQLSHSMLINRPPKTEVDADVRIVVRHADKAGSAAGGGNEFESTGSLLKDLLAVSYGTSAARIEMPAYLARDAFSVQAWVSNGDSESLKPLLQAAVQAAAGIRVRRETRLTEVVALSGFPGRLAPARKAPMMFQAESGKLSCAACSAEELRAQVERLLGKVVVLDNAPAGKFSGDLEWDTNRPGDFEAVLRERFGLELLPEKRPIEFLIVDALDAQPRSAAR